MKKLFVLSLLIPLWSAHGATEGRSLPQGENSPFVITSIYSSPQGEVQFLENDVKGISAMLRVPSGKLCEFKNIDGPAGCEDWFLTQARAAKPNGCTLIFDEQGDCNYRIQSDEMKEASLFQSVSRLVRSNSVAL